MKRQTSRILIADAATAHMVAWSGKGGDLKAVDDIQLEGNPAPSRELAADGPGRAFDRTCEGRHGVEPRTDARTVEQQRSARVIAGLPGRSAQGRRFERLILVASSKFMGLLRDVSPSKVGALAEDELIKDLAKTSIDDLPEHPAPVINP